jgi:hypothetical protein
MTGADVRCAPGSAPPEDSAPPTWYEWVLGSGAAPTDPVPPAAPVAPPPQIPPQQSGPGAAGAGQAQDSAAALLDSLNLEECGIQVMLSEALAQL